MSERKAVIKNADMSEEMQQDAVDCATQALEKYNIEKVRVDKYRFFSVYFYIKREIKKIFHKNNHHLRRFHQHFFATRKCLLGF